MKNEDLVNPDNIFKFRGNKYRMLSYCPTATIEMINIETGDKFSFGINAPIREEFKLMGKLICCCDEAKKDCEKECKKYRDKKKPDEVFLIPTWKKLEKNK